MTTTRTTRAFAYVRISKLDADTTSPQRQRKGIEDWCAAHNAELIETFEDLDLSAYRRGVRRPGFDAMMARLDQTDVVVTWRVDRLARSVSGFSKLLEAMEAAKVKLATTDGTVDTTTAQGRFTVNLTANLAELEAATTSERSRQMMSYKRANGEWVGRLPYGWRVIDKHLEPDRSQQVVLRKAASRYVSGESFSQIGRDLGFQTGPLSRMLHSQRVLEALPHELAESLSASMHERRWDRVPTSRQSLLGGIATCGICEGTLVRGSTRGGRSGRWAQYRCRRAGHVGIAAARLDELVTARVIAMVDTTKLVETIRRRQKLGQTRKASEVEARLSVLEESFVDGTMTEARYRELRERLLTKLEAARKQERTDDVDIPSDLARDLAQRWDDLSIGARRRIIQAVCTSVVVNKVRSRGGRVDPDRVDIQTR
jgi:site-specific DNA recombinase